ncbi:uncharacterized protein BDW43DRAFT_267797 [Aspergillus alliaceus]|nr:uncharacterized protein BDW43DRAFT_267797 [Aspergillus alliaceus]KAB8236197.1 hypothetical protein BDW43DRAFT_267797 [Aspergillus alliaceus]
MTVPLTFKRVSDHKASDCPNPRSAEGVECKRCNEGNAIQPQCYMRLNADAYM